VGRYVKIKPKSNGGVAWELAATRTWLAVLKGHVTPKLTVLFLCLKVHTDWTRSSLRREFSISMTFNFTIFLCFSNIRNHLSNFSYLACISCKICIRWRFYSFLETENSRRVAESRPVCVGLNLKDHWKLYRVTSLIVFCFVASFWRYFIWYDMQRTNFLRLSNKFAQNEWWARDLSTTTPM
jgi:hypothetical protein